jgi:hypothetical protein
LSVIVAAVGVKQGISVSRKEDAPECHSAMRAIYDPVLMPGGIIDEANPEIFSVSVRRLVEFLPEPEKPELIKSLKESA